MKVNSNFWIVAFWIPFEVKKNINALWVLIWGFKRHCRFLIWIWHFAFWLNEFLQLSLNISQIFSLIAQHRAEKRMPDWLDEVRSDWIWSGWVGCWCSYNVSLILIQTMSLSELYLFLILQRSYKKNVKVLISILPYLQVVVSRISHWVSQSVNDCPTYETPPLALAKGKAKNKMLPTSYWSGPPAGQTYKNCPHFIDLLIFLCWPHVNIRCQIL